MIKGLMTKDTLQVWGSQFGPYGINFINLHFYVCNIVQFHHSVKLTVWSIVKRSRIYCGTHLLTN